MITGALPEPCWPRHCVCNTAVYTPRHTALCSHAGRPHTTTVAKDVTGTLFAAACIKAAMQSRHSRLPAAQGSAQQTTDVPLPGNQSHALTADTLLQLCRHQSRGTATKSCSLQSSTGAAPDSAGAALHGPHPPSALGWSGCWQLQPTTTAACCSCQSSTPSCCFCLPAPPPPAVCCCCHPPSSACRS